MSIVASEEDKERFHEIIRRLGTTCSQIDIHDDKDERENRLIWSCNNNLLQMKDTRSRLIGFSRIDFSAVLDLKSLTAFYIASATATHPHPSFRRLNKDFVRHMKENFRSYYFKQAISNDIEEENGAVKGVAGFLLVFRITSCLDPSCLKAAGHLIAHDHQILEYVSNHENRSFLFHYAKQLAELSQKEYLGYGFSVLKEEKIFKTAVNGLHNCMNLGLFIQNFLLETFGLISRNYWHEKVSFTVFGD